MLLLQAVYLPWAASATDCSAIDRALASDLASLDCPASILPLPLIDPEPFRRANIQIFNWPLPRNDSDRP